jgi:uncharacterized membrane protein YphA (DoxX/SURF4 family)
MGPRRGRQVGFNGRGLMSVRAYYVEKYLVLAARYFFGAHTVVSGANHYLLWFPDPLPIRPGITGRFMQVLLDSHLYDVSRAIEIVVGLALLLGAFVPLALMFELPVTVIIFYLSVFMAGTPRIIYSGWRELALNMGLLACYWGYFKPLILSPGLPLRPLWRESLGSSTTDGRR